MMSRTDYKISKFVFLQECLVVAVCGIEQVKQVFIVRELLFLWSILAHSFMAFTCIVELCLSAREKILTRFIYESDFHYNARKTF
jgi:hypothetical protein